MTQDASDQLEELASGLSSFLDHDDEEQAAFDREIRRRKPVNYPDEAVPMDPQFDSDEERYGASPSVGALNSLDNLQRSLDLMISRRNEYREFWLATYQKVFVRGEAWVYIEAGTVTLVDPLSTLEPGVVIALEDPKDQHVGPANEGVIIIADIDTTGS